MHKLTQKALQVSRAGFGFFGDQFRDIVDNMNRNYDAYGLKMPLTIDEKSRSFLNNDQFSELCRAFHKMGFCDQVYSYENRIPTALSRDEFNVKLQNMHEKTGKTFFSGNTLSVPDFEETLANIAPEMKRERDGLTSHTTSQESHQSGEITDL